VILSLDNTEITDVKQFWHRVCQGREGARGQRAGAPRRWVNYLVIRPGR
jgi:hypothetical protein